MSLANYTISKIRDAYVQVHKLRIMLEDFQDGSPAPSVALGRFTLSELNTQMTTAIQALNSMAVGTTVVGLAVTGTLTVVGTATSQLTGTATKADLTTADVTTSAVWTSSNTAVATVGAATGLVAGVAAGTCTITCTYLGYIVTKTFTVT